jgi:uncharacterized membrane protein YedE/YeeE
MEVHLQTPSAPHWNPYFAGFVLGLVLLVSFVVLGAGLGASGAIARVGATAAHAVAPTAVETNAYFAPWYADGHPLRHYLVFMAIGIFFGGLASALAAGRRTRPLTLERGPRASAGRRAFLAIAGGVIAGFASRMAGGCTSGQALTGGALLLTGSWAFFIAIFAGAFGTAWFVRRQWN